MLRWCCFTFIVVRWMWFVAHSFCVLCRTCMCIISCVYSGVVESTYMYLAARVHKSASSRLGIINLKPENVILYAHALPNTQIREHNGWMLLNGLLYVKPNIYLISRLYFWSWCTGLYNVNGLKRTRQTQNIVPQPKKGIGSSLLLHYSLPEKSQFHYSLYACLYTYNGIIVRS